MYVALGATEPFHTAELNGVTYTVASDGFRSIFSGALVGWQVRSARVLGLGHAEDPLKDIERERTEVAKLTPYVESTGPKDPGDGYRWVDYRRQLGRGIIIIPPAGWKPGDDPWQLSHAVKGEITAIATEDFAQVREHVTGDKPGFVLVEPAEGWENAGQPAVGPSDQQEPSTSSLLIAAGATVAVAAIVYLVWGRR